MRPLHRTLIRHALPGLLAALMAALMAPSQAHVTEQSTVLRYPVRVQPSQTLAQALNAATPIRENGQVYHGHTKWWVNWHFRWFRQASGRCAITSVSVDLSTQIQAPELLQASAADRVRFDQYLPKLMQHEAGHRDNGRAAAAEVDRRDLALDVGEAPDRVGREVLAATLLHGQLLTLDGGVAARPLGDRSGGDDHLDHLAGFVGAVLHSADVAEGQEGGERPDDHCSDEDQRSA